MKILTWARAQRKDSTNCWKGKEKKWGEKKGKRRHLEGMMEYIDALEGTLTAVALSVIVYKDMFSRSSNQDKVSLK
ncbi:hypothetical protein BJX61DRAFT_507897 [Aspergillus egyptiacus]|nr:hypothetical protein BJX61DRAFT_507897 [Aspergillus egyptiacus]